MNQQATQNKTQNASQNDFKSVYSGKFFGVLRWAQLDDLWQAVRDNSEGWYLYAVGDNAPVEPSGKQETENFIKEIDGLLRREHDEDYCGIVYANDLNKPTLIKIFDPNNLGTSCSIAKSGPPPAWIMSKIKPVDLATTTQQTASRKRWWQKIFN